MSYGFDNPATCAIALGGNLGDSAGLFQQALSLLTDNRTRVSAISPLMTSSAMGSAAGDAFVNAAAILETDLKPSELLARLHEVEHALGRVRKIHWGPRPIDLDLLLFEQQVIDSALLVVPHPAMWHRRFVIEPLVQIAPDFKHPLLQQTVRQLYQHLQQRPLLIGISHDVWSRVSVSEVQHDLNNSYGQHTVQLVEQTATNDTQFAFLDLETCAAKSDHPRTQPAHQPDRTIIIHSATDAAEGIIRQTIADLCAGALG